jgi:hypothetical protein
VDHGHVREDGNHPEQWRHAVEERTDYYQHNPLGQLEKTHLAFWD